MHSVHSIGVGVGVGVCVCVGVGVCMSISMCVRVYVCELSSTLHRTDRLGDLAAY